MGDDSWSSVNQFIADYRSLLPDQDDLNGAALALIRLQDTYNLTMSDMANGYISTMNSMIQMSGMYYHRRTRHIASLLVHAATEGLHSSLCLPALFSA